MLESSIIDKLFLNSIIILVILYEKIWREKVKILKMPLLLFIAFAMITSLSFAGSWQILGKKKVNRMVDRDTIQVKAAKGTFTKIKLKVKKSGVHFLDVKVYFSNGEVFDVSVKKFIKAGHETRVIDLPGKRRKIKKVVFWYDTNGLKKGKGVVQLLGKR